MSKESKRHLQHNKKFLRAEDGLLSTLSINTEDLLSDLKFASGNGEILVCPFCGLEHDNGLTSRSEIIKDIQKANNLKDQINRELNILKHDIKRQKESIEKVENEYNILKIEVDRLEKEASIVETYKCEGKKEMINNGEIEIKNIQNELFNCIYIQNNLKKDLKDIESKPRKEAIFSSISINFYKILQRLNVPHSTELYGFIPIIRHFGSELPRVIIAYYAALYLHNLKRENNIFQWMVIDTPNQQGQDETNLQKIYSVFQLISSKRGQFIIGTERETGFEHLGSVYRLTECRRMLSNEKYHDHLNIFNIIDAKVFEGNFMSY